MTAPRATYRLQLHKDFTFDHAAEIVAYLAALGVSHVYASPITQARPGSMHGYDIVDHTRINDELGGEAGFVRLSDTLRAHGLGLILDIVPNHMGVGGADNRYWLSVLEWGELSPSARMFDIDWRRLGAGGKLVVPFLGQRYGLALEAGELQLRFDPEEGSFSVWHWEHRFPICPLHYSGILDRALAALGGIETGAEVLAVSERLRAMAEDDTPERRAEFPHEAQMLKPRLAAAASAPQVRDAVDRAVALINGAAGTPESFGALHRLLDAQHYRLAHWRVAASDINYRRFFDINALGGIRVEEPEVFALTHELVFRLVREGRVQGLRIDHIDGLADPAGYVDALQREIGPDFYILVEKILEPGETLRPWPVAGTTGYDALNVLDGVFIDTRSARRFDSIWRNATGIGESYGAQLRAAKEETVETSFASELEVLVSDLKRLADLDWSTRDYTVLALRRALVEIIARLPVYRTYIDERGTVDDADRALIVLTMRQARRWSVLPERSVHDFIRAALLGRVDTDAPGTAAPEDVARFRRRFQQLSGPVMAKSLEDTLFYRYVPFLALNEVGGDPGHFGLSVAEFHAANLARSENWPHAMIATATHDTKRGEDARARLSSLSETPDDWARAVGEWEEIAAEHLAEIEGEAAPDANDRYMILQSILGAWPFELLDGENADDIDAFRGRMGAWTEKALREAKRHTSWINPNEDYEAATAELLAFALSAGSVFLERFRPLAGRLAHLGALNGLSRTVLKCTVPGVPDIYQGTEFWDLSLVDPDNRRAVDYQARAEALQDVAADPRSAAWQSGRIKQFVLHRLLQDRAGHPDLYARGTYTPLDAAGGRAGHVLAFARTRGAERLAVVVPRLAAGFAHPERLAFAGDVWKGTSVPCPGGRWSNVLTDAKIDVTGGMVSADELFAGLPVAVLRQSR